MSYWSSATIKEDLAQKSLHKAVWAIALPMLLSNMATPLIGLVDSAVMGHLPEPHYLAAVGLGAALFTFIIWTMGFLRMITTGLVAQAFGAQNNVAIRQWLYLSSFLAVSISAIIFLLNPWIIKVILWWVDGSLAVEDNVQIYWNTRIWGLPFALLNAVMIGWFIGMQNARIPLMMLLVITFVNIVLDLYFVEVLGLTVEGVALASVIAEICGSMLGMFFLIKFLKQFPVAEKITFAWNKISYLLSLNGDLLIRTLALELVFFVIHARGAELGDIVMAVNAILLNFLLVIANGLDGFANAVEALVGKAMGRDRWREFRASITVAGFWSLILSLLFSLVFILFLPFLVSLITSIDDVLQAAKGFYIYIILVPIISIWSFWLDGVFIGASAIKTMRNSMLIAVLLGFIPIYFLTLSFDNHGLWWSYFAFMILRATVSWVFLNKGISKGRYISLDKITV